MLLRWRRLEEMFLSWILLAGKMAAMANTLGEHFETDYYRTQDNIVFGNSLLGSEPDVQLEDFFWTGSGDGPPAYLRKTMVAVSDSGYTSRPGVGANGGGYTRETIVRTATVLATVYVDGNYNGDTIGDDPLCVVDCDEFTDNSRDTTASANGKNNNFPSDRRYWLLTVLGGYFDDDDLPLLQKRFAKLYRIAFTRQHARHLGIVQVDVSRSGDGNDAANGRHNHNGNAVQLRKLERQKRNNDKRINNTFSNVTEQLSLQSTVDYRRGNDLSSVITTRTITTAAVTAIDDEFILNPTRLDVITTDRFGDNTAAVSNQNKTFSGIVEQKRQSIVQTGNNSVLPQTSPIVQRVNVVIYNLTLLAADDDQNTIISNSSSVWAANQTEIIYSVFVDGTPVLATTAADDMQLVDQLEVARMMEKIVITKAEPFLREPQATPLVPATRTVSDISALRLIVDNPIMIGIVSAAILLLLILLIGIICLAKAKRKRSAEVKRLTSSQALTQRQIATMADEIGSLKSDSDDSIRGNGRGRGNDSGRVCGIDNKAFVGTGRSTADYDEYNTIYNRLRRNNAAKSKQANDLVPVATIHFPQPPTTKPSDSPLSRSSTGNSGSSSSTSDSSIYYPKRVKQLGLQQIIDEKASGKMRLKRRKPNKIDRLTDGMDKQATTGHHHSGHTGHRQQQQQQQEQQQQQHQQEQRDNIYASVVKIKDQGGSGKKLIKHKKRYMSTENRVGSIEDPNDSTKLYDCDGHETLNHQLALSHYHTNKVLSDGTFTDGRPIAGNVTEATNPIIVSGHGHRSHKMPTQSASKSSADSGSIGSFLSMASIRSFPKCAVPEPLCRVLEPVSVTHLDYYGDVEYAANCHFRSDDATLLRTQSDGVDPGVIGPIVWELHKRETMPRKVATTGMHQRATEMTARNRYDGLIDGAMQLYMQPEPDLNEPDTDNVMAKLKDFRGKSAIIQRNAELMSATAVNMMDGNCVRPVTAGPATTEAAAAAEGQQHHSPRRAAAWGSGAPSPLVRPLSAGPFHRPYPTTPKVDVVRVLATGAAHSNISTAMQTAANENISTAPLIEAIHNELKKLKSDNDM